MQFDPLSDAFVRIYNAEQAGHYEVSIAPASNLLESMLAIMQSSGYVGEFERIADGRGDAFRSRAGWRHQQVRRHQTKTLGKKGRLRQVGV